ncbi:ABC transporter ATP-binding protein [Actinospica durhamensis]|uniref:Fatty acid ABC transporter ATP-binding/permease protein n=1 Tax=Actinospica durhamensis TaxID=1508375 RepID=A0A941EX50_9ACTN|nr:ABC transporter ATP-binding protein [Actinospica durhamensis]MBR7837952.1 ABC transporter ATP-binding protein [Actinospica durhamensis]
MSNAPEDSRPSGGTGPQEAKADGVERVVPQRGPGPAPGSRRGPGAFMAGQSTEKALDFKGSSKRLLATMSPERPLMLFALFLTAIGVTLNVLGPKILGNATNQILAGVAGEKTKAFAGLSRAQVLSSPRLPAGVRDMLNGVDFIPGIGMDFDAIGRTLGLVALIYFCSAIVLASQGRITTSLVQRAVYRMRQDAQAKLARLPLSYFDGQPRGEILSRVTNDMDNLSQTLQQTLSQIAMSLMTIVGVLTMMFYISWELALLALVTIPLSVVLAARIGKKAQPEFVKQWGTTGRLNGHIEEQYTGHTLVKVFGRQQEAIDEFDAQNETLYQASFRAQFISGCIQPAMMFIGNLNYVFIAVVGALKVASGSLSLGDVQAFVQYSRSFTQPVTQVASMSNLLQSAVASAERVYALLDAPEQSPDEVDAPTVEQVRGQVEFENVSFRYKAETPLIQDLSLSVKPGQTVAIVGPTGAGKTTLVNLLMRFYEIDEGRITLDGVDIARMTREDLRSRTGMVLQDAWLFGGTIAENIAYGVPNASIERIVAAAQATHVDRFVRTLPEGYDTVLDDEASSVSAGERQLITIARAFLAEPAILILDEATSSVDTRTEVLIQRAMNSLREGRTSFVIAHRLSTIRDADLILVMEQGRIVEQGTHESLLESQGAYSRLYEAQFASAVAEVD